MLNQTKMNCSHFSQNLSKTCSWTSFGTPAREIKSSKAFRSWIPSSRVPKICYYSSKRPSRRTSKIQTLSQKCGFLNPELGRTHSALGPPPGTLERLRNTLGKYCCGRTRVAVRVLAQRSFALPVDVVFHLACGRKVVCCIP